MHHQETRESGALPGPLRRGAALLFALLLLPGLAAQSHAAAGGEAAPAPAASTAHAAAGGEAAAAPAASAAASTTPAPFAPPPAPDYRVEAQIDWAAGLIAIDISLDLRQAGLRPPAGRLEAERMIERDLPGLLKDAVFTLAVDSHRLVADTVADGSIDINELLPLTAETRMRKAVYSPDFQGFRVSYDLPLLPVTGLYVRHSAPTRLRPLLGWSPTRAYTGLVIYATGLLPVHGENVADRLRPCLFPRIWDEDMNLLFDRNIVAPAALRAGGPVAYGTGAGLLPAGRVGNDPLKIAALEVFGDLRTDLVISREDARRLLSLPANRELLAAGRVFIALDTPATRMSY